MRYLKFNSSNKLTCELIQFGITKCSLISTGLELRVALVYISH